MRWILAAPLFCVALLLGGAQGAWASNGPVQVTGCAGWGLAQRTGSPGCWAELSFRQDEQAAASSRVCLSHELWIAWLSTAEGGKLCGHWEGKWKLNSPPLNELNEGPAPGKPARAKPTFLILQASRFPTGRASWLERLRLSAELMRERTDQWIAPWDETGILRELVTGTRHPGGTLELLGTLGFIHLLMASGIHLYALAKIWGWMIKQWAIRADWLPLGWARRARALGEYALWLAAWGLAGARPGMLRPWLVICLRSGAGRLGLRWRRLAPLLVALGLDAAVGAWRGNLASPGRWVYALACAGGLLARSSPGMALGSWVLAAAPLAWRSGTLALATPIVSAITIPVFAGALYPLLLLSAALKTCGLAVLASAVTQACGALASWLAHALAAAVMRGELLWILSRPSLAAGVILAAATLGARRRLRFAALALIIAGRLAWALHLGLYPVASALALDHLPEAASVEQLDIGQGDAALVTSPAGAGDEPRFGMIDSGSEHSLSDRDWIELLSRRGARKIDWIALTHLDEDHSGGVKRLGRLVPIGCVATARELIESPRGSLYKQALERLGIRLTDWSGNCVPYPALAPPSGGEPGKANAFMGAVFVPLRAGGFYLSAGDADAQDEPRIGAWARALASRLPESVPRILKISHHGSKTSSNPRFIEEVRPTEAWISVGAGNHYGHPSAVVLEELRQLAIPVRRTDQEGGISR